MGDCGRYEQQAVLAADAKDLVQQLNVKFTENWMLWPGLITQTETGIVAIVVRQKQQSDPRLMPEGFRQ